MKATFTLYPNPDAQGAFGYNVESDAGHRIGQDYAPGASGNVPMTESEATAYAEALIAELTAPPAADAPSEPA